jgi:hypothetical protein
MKNFINDVCVKIVIVIGTLLIISVGYMFCKNIAMSEKRAYPDINNPITEQDTAASVVCNNTGAVLSKAQCDEADSALLKNLNPKVGERVISSETTIEIYSIIDSQYLEKDIKKLLNKNELYNAETVGISLIYKDTDSFYFYLIATK